MIRACKNCKNCYMARWVCKLDDSYVDPEHSCDRFEKKREYML